MGKSSGIAWTDATFNPWRGCVKVSEACRFCYADAFSHRNPKILGVFGTEANGGTRVVAADAYWKEPRKWDKAASIANAKTYAVDKCPSGPRVFCASLADSFEAWRGPMLNSKGEQLYHRWHHAQPEWVASSDPCDCDLVTMSDVRRRLFDLIDNTLNLNWLLLTKRPENIRQMWNPKREYADQYTDDPYPNADAVTTIAGPAFYRNNAWVGATVENREQAEKRIPELLKNHDLAPVLFLSMEPLLGPVDLSEFQYWRCPVCGNSGISGWSECRQHGELVFGHGIRWVIVGCESGPNRRETKLEWVRDLRDQCKRWSVPFFVKQLEVDGQVTDDLAAFPSDLQIREFPNA